MMFFPLEMPSLEFFSPVAVRRLGIRDPPHVLGRPGGLGPPAGNWDTTPLTRVSSEIRFHS